MKRTPWFPASVKPVRVGVYECLYAGCILPQKRLWTGKRWELLDSDDACAFGHFSDRDKWRGLAEQPK